MSIASQFSLRIRIAGNAQAIHNRQSVVLNDYQSHVRNFRFTSLFYRKLVSKLSGLLSEQFFRQDPKNLPHSPSSSERLTTFSVKFRKTTPQSSGSQTFWAADPLSC